MIFHCTGALAKCASGGRDHTSCCNRRGVPAKCISLCRGVLPQPPVDCLSFGGNIIQCFEEGKYFLLCYITVFVCKSFIIIFTLSCNDFNKLCCQFPPFSDFIPVRYSLCGASFASDILIVYLCYLFEVLILFVKCQYKKKTKQRTGVAIHRSSTNLCFSVEIFQFQCIEIKLLPRTIHHWMHNNHWITEYKIHFCLCRERATPWLLSECFSLNVETVNITVTQKNSTRCV